MPKLFRGIFSFDIYYSEAAALIAGQRARKVAQRKICIYIKKFIF